MFCPGFLFVIHLLNLFCFLYSVQQQERESARESVPLLLRESFLSPKVRCSFTLTENTVEPWFNEVPGDWGNLCVISRDRYIEHLHVTNFRENYQNVINLQSPAFPDLKNYSNWSVWHSSFITSWHLFVMSRYILRLRLWIVFAVTRILLDRGSLHRGCTVLPSAWKENSYGICARNVDFIRNWTNFLRQQLA